MASIVLTAANRRYTQPEATRSEGMGVTGSDGDDVVELYFGTVEGKAGNDLIRRIDLAYGALQVAYWTSPRGVRVNLAEGWADDGFGGRDTIIGATDVVGSQFDDVIIGNEFNNSYYGQAGRDEFFGGGGIDSISAAGFLDSTGRFRGAMLLELVIESSPDGRTFVVKDPTGTGNFFQYTIHDVELIRGEFAPGVNGILGLASNRLYVQGARERSERLLVLDTAGDDTIDVYDATVNGGAGNDLIRCLDLTNGSLELRYSTSPKGVQVHLGQGWAEDGFGGRDTLVGVTRVVGSSHDDIVWGGPGNDFLSGSGGNDTFLGGVGDDGISLPDFVDSTGRLRQALLSELIIEAGADGRSFVVKDPTGTGRYFQYTLRDVEYILGDLTPGVRGRYSLIRTVDTEILAQQTIVAGDEYRWNPSQPTGSSLELTFSFMSQRSADGQRPFSTSEQAVVRQILASVSEITLLTFREVEEAAGVAGQLRFTVTQQLSSKGYTILPSAATLATSAGDIYMDVESMLDLTPGSQGFEALLHEIGHALGLRHPVNVNPSDKWALQAAPIYNSTQFTVMAPTNEGLGLSRSTWGPLDVAALRYLYGTRIVHVSDSLIVLSDTSGQSLTTVLDDGGIDTLDCSSLALGVQIDLNPAASSSVGRDRMGLQVIGNISLGTSTQIENVIGTSMDDVLVGNAAENIFRPLSGNDWIDGAPGWDRVILTERASGYTLGFDGLRLTFASTDGRSGFKTLTDIEVVAFADRQVEVASKRHAGFGDVPASMYQFFILAFGAAPGVEYLQQCADAYRSGASVKLITNVFTGKSQFTDIYPTSQSNRDMATKLVTNVVGPSATQAARDEAIRDITGALDNGLSRGDMIFTVFSNLAALKGDAKWGGTAQLFFNQIAVAKFYTETMNQSTVDRATLAAAISGVTATSDVSTDTAVVSLIGQGLLGG